MNNNDEINEVDEHNLQISLWYNKMPDGSIMLLRPVDGWKWEIIDTFNDKGGSVNPVTGKKYKWIYGVGMQPIKELFHDLAWEVKETIVELVEKKSMWKVQKSIQNFIDGDLDLIKMLDKKS